MKIEMIVRMTSDEEFCDFDKGTMSFLFDYCVSLNEYSVYKGSYERRMKTVWNGRW